MLQILDHLDSAKCDGCDKDGKECVILKTEAFTAPHCMKCTFREARKRKPKGQPDTTLFDRAS